MRSRSTIFTASLAVGLVTGWVLVQQRLERHRRDLFSRHPMRRLAALGFLAGQHGVDTVRLLQDYLSWERQPMLRRRAEAIVRRMEATLA